MVLLVLVTLLSGCGFRPLYLKGKQNPQPDLTAIEIRPIVDRKGQILRNLLLDQLMPKGPSAHSAYVLKVGVDFSLRDLGVRHNDRATRALMKVTATYSLKRKQDETLLFSGTSQANSGYDILDSDFATLVAEKDALQHSLETIARDIKLRLSFLFSSDPGGNKAAKKFRIEQKKRKQEQKRLEQKEEGAQ
jgi:LPS-assembly lipoprotein